jgi:putative membrane protein
MIAPLLPLQAGGHGHAAGGADPWTVWAFEPVVLLVLGAVAVLYAHGWWRLRSRGRGDLATIWRAFSFYAGLNVLVIALLSPLHNIAYNYLLSAHMAQHMLLGDVATILMVLGLSGPLLLFVVPRPVLRFAARPRMRPVMRFIGRPATAFVAWVLVTALWYVPALYEAALSSTALHWTMQVSIVVTGFMVWAHIVGIIPHLTMSLARRAGYAMGLLLASMIVGKFLFLRDPMYDIYINQADRIFDWSPEADQIRASLLMMSVHMITLITAATLLMWTHMDRAVAERDAAVPELVS